MKVSVSRISMLGWYFFFLSFPPCANSHITLFKSFVIRVSYPGLKFDPAQILHGEEFVELLCDKLPLEGAFIQKSRVLDFLDKGKGGLLVVESLFYPVDGASGNQPVVRLVRSTFIRGLGGHGGRKKLSNDPRAGIPGMPNRAPDAVFAEKIPVNQALLYRLTGDTNPLHVDPAVATAVGFKAPILHGLCSFGFAVRTVIKAFGDSIQSIGCRFSSPVYPGDELETRCWRLDASVIVFEARVKGVLVISDGICRLRGGAKL